MQISARPTIVLDMPLLHKAADLGEGSMIRLIFSAKCSVVGWAVLVEEFLSLSLEGARSRLKIDNGGRICVMTCKSHWKKPLPGLKRKLRFGSSTLAINVRAVAPSPAHALAVFPPVADAGK